MNKVNQHKFPFSWNLSDGFPAKGIEYHGAKVFSCFSCGGGSTMGYKLAGYNVIGFNEIDPKMAECYIENFNPKYKIIKPIQIFKNYKKFPKELYNLDILDGSPPCSNFSMAGNREKDWGKKKKFREGQKEQVLDVLFFDFIDLAERLKPKIIVAENVKGLIMGNAKKYLSKIMMSFEKIGYSCICKLLDASKMEVPQKRERVFIIGIRNDLLKYVNTSDLFNKIPKLNLNFNKKEIPFRLIEIKDKQRIQLNDKLKKRWVSINKYENYSKTKKGNTFGFLYKASKNKVFSTILASSGQNCCHYNKPEKILNEEFIKISTFPKDYNFLENDPKYLMGMSVPPVMMAQISHRIKEQWLDKVKGKND